MKPLFIQYPKCGTCRKAAKWLENNGIDVDSRDITIDRPTSDELKRWIPTSGLQTSKFFNTSGLIYKERGLKDVVRTAKEAELVELLSSEGKLVKRPLLITEDAVLVGFDEEKWRQTLLK